MNSGREALWLKPFSIAVGALAVDEFVAAVVVGAWRVEEMDCVPVGKTPRHWSVIANRPEIGLVDGTAGALLLQVI